MDNHTQALVVPPYQAELPADLDVFRVGEILAKSGYFADVKDMAQAVAKILAGREMGFGPIASLTGVYIQNGRPCYSANMIAAAIKKSRRYDYRVKRLDGQGCDLEFYEGGKPVGVSSFTVKDAEQAGLTAGKNAHSWRNYPRNMLFARALTNGARFHCPDVFGGIPVYTPEEMGVVIDGESGEAIKADNEPPQRQPERPLVTAPKPDPQHRPQAPVRPVATPATHTDTLIEDKTQKPDAILISEAQQRRLFPLLKEAGVAIDDFRAFLLEQYKLEHTKDITRHLYDAICNDITKGGITAWLVAAETTDEPEPGSEG